MYKYTRKEITKWIKDKITLAGDIDDEYDEKDISKMLLVKESKEEQSQEIMMEQVDKDKGNWNDNEVNKIIKHNIKYPPITPKQDKPVDCEHKIKEMVGLNLAICKKCGCNFVPSFKDMPPIKYPTQSLKCKTCNGKAVSSSGHCLACLSGGLKQDIPVEKNDECNFCKDKGCQMCNPTQPICEHDWRFYMNKNKETGKICIECREKIMDMPIEDTDKTSLEVPSKIDLYDSGLFDSYHPKAGLLPDDMGGYTQRAFAEVQDKINSIISFLESKYEN